MALRRPPTAAELVGHAGELIRGGRLKPAERILKDILKSAPTQFDALLMLGSLHGMQGQSTEALKHLQRAARARPNDPAVHYNIGQVLMQLGRHAEAVASLQAALALSDLAHIHEKLGDCLRQLGRLDEAARHYRRTVELDPSNSLALSSAVETLRKICDWNGLVELEERLVAAAASGQPVEPLLLLHVYDDPALQRRSTEAYYRALIRPAAVNLAPRAPARPAAKLRVGYISADFRQHPMVSVIAELIEHHDRNRFEVSGFSYGPDDGSPQRKRMRAAFDRFHDVRTLSDAQMARHIADCGIDILVGLAGYTANARLAAVAARPAPIICHYMGYPGTLGGPTWDYYIADPVVAPPGSDRYFHEALVRLPECYWAVDNKRAVGPETTRREHGLPEDAVVLSSFNGQQKLSPLLLDTWARILVSVPEAVLWLYSDNAEAADRLRREVEARGLAAHRLIMAGRVPPAEHLARIRLADLMLDTLPYGGHTTVCDALWMGVPSITVTGRAFASRVGASLLQAAGLPELAMPSLADYEAEAIVLARDPARLADSRRRLAASRATCPLFDTTRFARHLEAAYLEMAARRNRGEPPRPIDVAPIPRL